MKNKNFFLCLFAFLFVQTYAQKYHDNDFSGYVNYTNIPLVNVRFNPLLFDYVLNREPEYYSGNKIKKITYLLDGQLSQSVEYDKDGNVKESFFKSGSKYLTSKNKDEIVTIEYINNKENFISSKKITPEGKLIRIKNQYAVSKNDSTVNKFYYENNKIIKKEQYFNNKIQRKSEFKYDKNLLINIVNTDYVVQVQPKQISESENITYKYDANGNCISIENINYFGVLKNKHFFTYNNQNKLVKEIYSLNEGVGSQVDEGFIEYGYDNKNRVSKIIEKNKQKASSAVILYGENNKIKSVTINCDSCYSTYFPISFYPNKMINIYDFKYDEKENMIEMSNTINGELRNKTEFAIEYY